MYNKVKRSHATIRAPGDGTISAVAANVGELVVPVHIDWTRPPDVPAHGHVGGGQRRRRLRRLSRVDCRGR